MMLGDLWIDHLGADRPYSVQGSFLIDPDEARISCHIGCQDRCQPTLSADSPPPCSLVLSRIPKFSCRLRPRRQHNAWCRRCESDLTWRPNNHPATIGHYPGAAVRPDKPTLGAFSQIRISVRVPDSRAKSRASRERWHPYSGAKHPIPKAQSL